jgi:KTSC domain
MLVKRLEKSGKIKAMYSSSTICASIFDTATKDLVVIFNNGGQYKYPNVADSDYMRLEMAESSGNVFNTYIKKKYTNFEKMESLESDRIKAILTEVEELKPKEPEMTVEMASKQMIANMLDIVSKYVETSSIDTALLSSLEEKLTKFKEIKK